MYIIIPMIILLWINKGPEIKATPLIIAYYPNWARWRTGHYSFRLRDVNGTLITHLIYAFLKPTSNGKIIIETPEDFLDLLQFKDKFPNVKIILSVGGAGNYSIPFNDIVSSKNRINNFAENAKNLLLSNNFDGLDLDWEYAGVNQKNGFMLLIKTLAIKFKSDLKKPLLLLAAVSSSRNQIIKSYNIREMNKYLDYFNLMSYDFHGSWGNTVNHNSPLRSNDMLSLEYALNYYILNGASVDKINIGLAFYGRSFTLKDPNQTSPGSPSVKKPAPLAGNITSESGYLAYFEIKDLNWTEKWDDFAKVPYTFKGRDWISYDNLRSYSYKIKYSCLKKVRGYMLWDISMDDLANNLLFHIYSTSKLICDKINLFPS
ncbi:acidic mammalian chitinase-like [Gordionus sp. m RMFG-2023]|uniref:acidic mammalian chitinase-like n=1 Tax=Gordionus sp. m RMFG-2023 TaxID=3053472 RepID=UPI0031FC2729